MSTRATIRFATREDGVTFSEIPEVHHAQFYKHSDGYPEGLGVEIAESFLHNDSVYLEFEHQDIVHGDIDYLYYIWSAPGKSLWISIFKKDWEVGDFECIFVGQPQKLLDKYKNTAINKAYEKLLDKYKQNTNTNG
jgi:hypothetical protein